MLTESIVVKHNPVMIWETFEHTFHSGDWKSKSLRAAKRDMGGYRSAGWEIPLTDRARAIDWLHNGVGRDVGMFTPDGRMYWEGFINEITLNTGTIQITMSLRGMANKVWGRRSPVGGGAVTRSTVQNHTASQGRFGIKEEILNCGEMSASPAANLAQKYLDLHYWPTLSKFGWSRGSPSLKFSCRGYWHTLGWRVYTQTDDAGEANVSAVVQAVVDGIGEFVASSVVETNTTQAARKFDSDRRADEILENYAGMGDSLYQRWIAGIGAGREFYYKVAARGKI